MANFTCIEKRQRPTSYRVAVVPIFQLFLILFLAMHDRLLILKSQKEYLANRHSTHRMPSISLGKWQETKSMVMGNIWASEHAELIRSWSVISGHI